MPRPYMLQRLVWVVVVFFPIALLGSCAPKIASPSDKEISDIGAGKKTLVLFRVAARMNGEAHRPFANVPRTKDINFGIGTFETAGRPEPFAVKDMRFLSESSLEQGWTYLLVKPGTLYLVFVPPYSSSETAIDYLATFQTGQRWRVDIPGGSRVIYIGTVTVEGDSDSSMFSGKFLKNFRNMEIGDDSAEAQRLVDQNLPGLGKIRTVLMQRHEGTIILKTPTN